MNKQKRNTTNFDSSEFKTEALSKLKAGHPLTGKNGVLTQELLEAALEGEMDGHLNTCREEGVGNQRNGKGSKTVKSSSGAFELQTPRDREGSFEPEIVKKRQTVLNESLDNKVLALYALGMSSEAISEHLDVWA